MSNSVRKTLLDARRVLRAGASAARRSPAPRRRARARRPRRLRRPRRPARSARRRSSSPARRPRRSRRRRWRRSPAAPSCVPSPAATAARRTTRTCASPTAPRSSCSSTRPSRRRPSRRARPAAAAVAAAPVTAAVRGRARGAEKALTGETAAKVKAAALKKVPGGTVLRVETDADHGSPYEAHVRKSDGTEVEVLVNKDFEVDGRQRDAPPVAASRTEHARSPARAAGLPVVPTRPRSA